jgi:hypothetical protein
MTVYFSIFIGKEIQLEKSDKYRLLKKINCLDDSRLDRVESCVSGREEQRQRLTGVKRIRRFLKQDRDHMIVVEDVS